MEQPEALLEVRLAEGSRLLQTVNSAKSKRKAKLPRPRGLSALHCIVSCLISTLACPIPDTSLTHASNCRWPVRYELSASVYAGGSLAVLVSERAIAAINRGGCLDWEPLAISLISPALGLRAADLQAFTLQSACTIHRAGGLALPSLPWGQVQPSSPRVKPSS